ncbi:hypothetical protein ACHQM5_010444 [Ranunculus cassubicifolius]
MVLSATQPLDGEKSEEVDVIKFIQRIQQIHQQVRENLEKAQRKYKERHDKHRTQHTFQVGDLVWLHIGKARLQGPGRKLKPLRYGPFQILEQYGTNAFKLDLPGYMRMYSVANAENLKLFEPSLLDERDTAPLLPSVHDLIPSEVVSEDLVLGKKTRKTRLGEQEFWWICPKGQYANRAKWYSEDQVRERFPHLLT